MENGLLIGFGILLTIIFMMWLIFRAFVRFVKGLIVLILFGYIFNLIKWAWNKLMAGRK